MVRQLQCERTREKKSFEPLSANSKIRSWRNDVWKVVPEAASGDWKSSVINSWFMFVKSVAAMMTMNEVVDDWNRQHVGSNQIGSEERDRVNIDKHW